MEQNDMIICLFVLRRIPYQSNFSLSDFNISQNEQYTTRKKLPTFKTYLNTVMWAVDMHPERNYCRWNLKHVKNNFTWTCFVNISFSDLLHVFFFIWKYTWPEWNKIVWTEMK